MTGIEVELKKRICDVSKKWFVSFEVHQGDSIYDRFVLVASKRLRRKCVDDVDDLIKLFRVELGISIIIKRKCNNRLLWETEAR